MDIAMTSESLEQASNPDTMLDGLESYIRQAKKQLSSIRKSGETSRELSCVMTKLDEAGFWLNYHRSVREAGGHENAAS